MNTNMDSHKWLLEYQRYIYDVIAPIAVPGASNSPEVIEVRKKMVSNDAMKYWVRSVTHESFDPNNDANYENLETLGDTTMKNVFLNSIIHLNPGIEPETITNQTSAELWRVQQAKISERLGLSKWLRSIYPLTQGVSEDLLEAMFGALMFVGEDIIGPGNGYIMCTNTINNLYSDMMSDFDTNNTTGVKTEKKNPKQTLKEIADKLGWYSNIATLKEFGKPIRKESLTGDTIYNLIFRLPEKAKMWIHKNGGVVKNNGILASVTSANKSEAEDLAAVEALKTLKTEYNVDWDSAKKTFDASVLARMEKDSLVDLYLNKKDKYNQLIGVTKNGEKVILLTVINEKVGGTDKSINNEIFNLYSLHGKQPFGNILHLTA